MVWGVTANENALRELARVYLQRAVEAEATLLALVKSPASNDAWAAARRLTGMLEPEYRIGDPIIGPFRSPND